MSQFSHQVNQLQNIAQFIAEKLEAMILNGELAPGDRLVQTEIADQFGVSRLPVRDAFAILQKKDLVVNLPRKGVQVRRIDEEEIANLFELRELVECYAVQKSLPRMTGEEIDRLESLIKEQKRLGRGEFATLLEVDEAFHRTLWRHCGNRDLEEQLSVIWRRLKLVRAHTRALKSWKKASVENHERLVQSLREGDLKAALKNLREGMRRSRSEILECLTERAG